MIGPARPSIEVDTRRIVLAGDGLEIVRRPGEDVHRGIEVSLHRHPDRAVRGGPEPVQTVWPSPPEQSGSVSEEVASEVSTSSVYGSPSTVRASTIWSLSGGAAATPVALTVSSMANVRRVRRLRRIAVPPVMASGGSEHPARIAHSRASAIGRTPRSCPPVQDGSSAPHSAKGVLQRLRTSCSSTHIRRPSSSRSATPGL